MFNGSTYIYLSIFVLIVVNLFLVIRYFNIGNDNNTDMANIQKNEKETNSSISFWHVILGLLILCIVFYLARFLAFHTHESDEEKTKLKKTGR